LDLWYDQLYIKQHTLSFQHSEKIFHKADEGVDPVPDFHSFGAVSPGDPAMFGISDRAEIFVLTRISEQHFA
jgi:hypothetical protein